MPEGPRPPLISPRIPSRILTQATDPLHKEGFLERMLQPHHHHQQQRRRSSASEGEREKPDLAALALERSSSNEEEQHPHSTSHSNLNSGQTDSLEGSADQKLGTTALRRQRRNSRLQRFREYMASEKELDEDGEMYAKLM
ncbi:hypothetical protein BDW74DRAFT_164386 [Aspergillus multicolor]|uniref:uncharacterized protein n=1 Tax=Aspergillus multicolor TaxID=41759 RepID=UPI003CCD9385